MRTTTTQLPDSTTETTPGILPGAASPTGTVAPTPVNVDNGVNGIDGVDDNAGSELLESSESTYTFVEDDGGEASKEEVVIAISVFIGIVLCSVGVVLLLLYHRKTHANTQAIVASLLVASNPSTAAAAFSVSPQPLSTVKAGTPPSPRALLQTSPLSQRESKVKIKVKAVGSRTVPATIHADSAAGDVAAGGARPGTGAASAAVTSGYGLNQSQVAWYN